MRYSNREPAIIYINCHFLALAYLLFVYHNSVGLMVVQFGIWKRLWRKSELKKMQGNVT